MQRGNEADSSQALFLTCTRCDNFTGDESECGGGKIFPCLHVICRKCLETAISSNENIECVKCGIMFNGNQLNESCLTSISREFMKNKCTACTEKYPAEFKCEDPQCGDLLCRICESAHRRVKATRNHRIIQLETKPTEESCLSHENLKTEFFCTSCNVNFCKICFVEKQHEGHPIATSLPETVCHTLNALSQSNFVQNLTTLAGQVDRFLACTGEKLRYIDECESGWRREMEATVKVIELMCTAKREPYSMLKENTDRLRAMVDQVRSFLQTVIKSTDQDDRLLQQAFALLNNSRQLLLKLCKSVQQIKATVGDVTTLPIPNKIASNHLNNIKASAADGGGPIDLNNLLLREAPQQNYSQPLRTNQFTPQNHTTLTASNFKPTDFAVSKNSTATYQQWCPISSKRYNESAQPRETYENVTPCCPCPMWPDPQLNVNVNCSSYPVNANNYGTPLSVVTIANDNARAPTPIMASQPEPYLSQPQPPLIQLSNLATGFWQMSSVEQQDNRFGTENSVITTAMQSGSPHFFTGQSSTSSLDQSSLQVQPQNGGYCRRSPMSPVCEFCFPKKSNVSPPNAITRKKRGPPKKTKNSVDQSSVEPKRRKPRKKRKNDDAPNLELYGATGSSSVMKSTNENNKNATILSTNFSERNIPTAGANVLLNRQDSQECRLIICEDEGNVFDHFSSSSYMQKIDCSDHQPNKDLVTKNVSKNEASSRRM